jgi:hypothetical protein
VRPLGDRCPGPVRADVAFRVSHGAARVRLRTLSHSVQRAATVRLHYGWESHHEDHTAQGCRATTSVMA